MLIPINIKTNLIGFDKVIERACTTDAPDSFYSVLEQFIHQVQAEVIHQYDITRRGFSRRKSADVIKTRMGKDFYAPTSDVDYSDALRNALNQPPRVFFGANFNGSITASIVDTNNLPFYWKFQEFGTRPFTHSQPFVVKPGAGGSMKFHPIKKSLVNSSPDFNIGNGFRRTEYGLIKDIEIKHPGIKARNFLIYGKNYIANYGGSVMSGLIHEMLSKLVNNFVSGKSL